RKFREATEADAAGVVFLFVLNRKTTPSALSVGASRHFLSCAASPPCSDARRGIPLPCKLMQRATPSFATASRGGGAAPYKQMSRYLKIGRSRGGQNLVATVF